MPEQETPTVERPLSPAGIVLRLAATVFVLVGILYGTLYGTDDDFPFAPFRMFANSDNVNKPVKSARLEAVTEEGDLIVVRGAHVGMRRAEFEGQIRRFRADRELMGALAKAYARRNPDRPELVQINVVVRHYELDRGRPTKRFPDDIEVSWYRSES